MLIGAFSALRFMKSTNEISSITGLVSGINTIEVMPPAAAALAAVLIVSRFSFPGSPEFTRISIRPGAHTRP